MPITLKRFQQEAVDGLVARFDAVRARYDELGPDAPEAARDAVRHRDGAVMLQAPTGSGKTVVAIETMAAVSARGDRLLWFWFAPFAGVTEQARRALRTQAPQLPVLDLDTDRRLDALRPGGVFVTTWQSVAAANAASRRARQKSDAGLPVDALIAQARAAGWRIACVVDEAHHGFQAAKQAREFFARVLKPDYALLMTATPDDADARRFARDTGFDFGGPERWASISRSEGVDARLLKRGVKLVRFIAPDADTRALVDFERTAIDECVKMHRLIQQRLADNGVALTPLMLVQIPDDPAHRRAKGEPSAIEEWRRRLVRDWGFAESAVRVHTADEPDADVLALAHDPTVEVLIFKMAVALGFDAPRAFTLAALRGVRDEGFGVQVIGRLMRVPAPLQARDDLPRELDHGYVFLANAESQEGLLDAGRLIAAMQTQAPDLGTQTVVTVVAGRPEVQVVRPGEPLALIPLAERAAGVAFIDEPVPARDADEGQGDDGTPREHTPSPAGHADPGSTCPAGPLDGLPLFGGEGATPPARGLAGQLVVDARRSGVLARRAPQVPPMLVTEWLPPLAGGLEERVAALADFAPVLASVEALYARIYRNESEVFADGIQEERDAIFAALRPEAIAQRVEAQFDLFPEIDRNRLLNLLAARLAGALQARGIRPPDAGELEDRLDLVLARHPELLRHAFRAARLDEVQLREFALPDVLPFDAPGTPAQRNAYCRMPEDLNGDERAFAQLLDAEPRVRWWHRNRVGHSGQPPVSVGLFSWDDGAGFYPDFVVALDGREGSPGGIVLVEVKGPQYWGKDSEVRKIDDGWHPHYGEIVCVGRLGTAPFQLLRPSGSKLLPAGTFDIAQLVTARVVRGALPTPRPPGE